MGCSRCGQNRPQQRPTQPPMPQQRPGSMPTTPRPAPVNPSDAIRHAIDNLRYVPR